MKSRHGNTKSRSGADGVGDGIRDIVKLQIKEDLATA
jgi:hypothetical protein